VAEKKLHLFFGPIVSRCGYEGARKSDRISGKMIVRTDVFYGVPERQGHFGDYPKLLQTDDGVYIYIHILVH
jgi:hypothetical protein